MATINMNAVQFYDPSSTAPSLSARCAATLQKYRQSTRIPHRKQWSRVLESYSQSQNTGKDTASKQDDDAGDGSIAAEEDDEFLPVDEVIRRALHLEDSTKKPTNSALAAQGTNETSFLDGSGSSMLAQSSLLGHLDGSKEQPVILDDDDDDDDDENNNYDHDHDDDSDDNNDDNSNSTSGEGISSDLNANGTSRELGPPPSPTTPYPGSRPSSSRHPSLHPSAAPHDQLLEGQAIQQDDSCISREMSEQPSCPALVLLHDEDDETDKGQQQQEVGEDGEKEARNSDASSNGDIDDDGTHVRDNNECESLPLAKQHKLSPSCDPAIRSSCKRRLQHSDNGISTIQPTQQQHQEICQEKESDYDHRDDQDSNDSEAPRPAKRRRPSPSSSDLTRRKRTLKHHFQRPREREPTSNTRAEYQEWPIRGVFKRVIVGDEVRYGMEFSLEEPRTCPQHRVSHQSTDGGDPQPDELWDIQRITGMRKVNGAEEFRVAWAQTWMPESELGGARELVEEFKARLSVQRGKKKGQGKPDATGEKASKRQRGRPRKQV